MYILNFKTIRYKPTALGKIIHSILKYKPMRPVRIYGYLKNEKHSKTAN